MISFILGKCRCGCNEDITIRQNSGYLRRFISGHQMNGKHHSEETIKKMSAIKKGKKFTEEHKRNLSKNSGNWKGDRVSLKSLHDWVRKHLPIPKFCEMCNKTPPYDLANLGIYNRDFTNWTYYCRKCHMISDGRLERFRE